MSGGVSLSVRFSPSWRSASGRFARSPVAGSVAAGFQSLGSDSARRLSGATPRRSGRMAASWRSTYVPSSMQLRITNMAAYWAFVVWGTQYMQANPALQNVIDQELPRMLRTTADEIGRRIVVGLRE